MRVKSDYCKSISPDNLVYRNVDLLFHELFALDYLHGTYIDLKLCNLSELEEFLTICLTDEEYKVYYYSNTTDSYIRVTKIYDKDDEKLTPESIVDKYFLIVGAFLKGNLI